MIDDKLQELVARYDAIQAELSLPETSTDPDALRRLGRELARLEPVVSSVREVHHLGLQPLEADEARIVDELKVSLLPRDPADDGNVILEIRAGAGGDEAALFAAELLRMYLAFADKHR